jgi:hypothetical protein
MSEQILTNRLFSNLSPEEQEVVKGGQFVGAGGYNNLSVLGGGYGYPNVGYGGSGYPGFEGYNYPDYGGYTYPGFGFYPGIRRFGIFPGAVSGY